MAFFFTFNLWVKNSPISTYFPQLYKNVSLFSPLVDVDEEFLDPPQVICWISEKPQWQCLNIIIFKGWKLCKRLEFEEHITCILLTLTETMHPTICWRWEKYVPLTMMWKRDDLPTPATICQIIRIEEIPKKMKLISL